MSLVNELPNDALDEDLIALKGATMTLTQSPEAEQAVEEKHTQEDEEANETKDAESGMAGLGALFE
jgi:ribosomal protein L12E/L44/L45/RPP1/RPP2